MMNMLKWLGSTLSIMAIWFALNMLATNQAWFVQALAPSDESAAFFSAVKKSLEKESNGNLALALIEHGKIQNELALSKGLPVNGDSVFGVASVSKWVTAVGVMVLVEQEKLSLDQPISTYLTRWQLPKSQFGNDGVTVRRLLSHTAGITDGLGHNGFLTRAQIQPLTAHLTQAKDADEGVDGRVIVGLQPGSQFKYSGGSYNLLQLVVEEVSGMSFEQYMRKAVFEPLGMNNTSYRHDEVANLVQYFDETGNEREYPFYTSLAATGLYSSVNDLYRFTTLFFPQNLHNDTTEHILSDHTIKAMRVANASSMGFDIWGLGTMLFSNNNAGDYIIGHGGQSPSLNATVRINPLNGNGIILLETGNRALAADTATQWTLWETGNPDIYMLKNMFPVMLKRVIVGCVVILISSLIIAWRRKVKVAQ